MWQALLLPGNAVALVVVGFLLHVQATLFAAPPPPAPPPPFAAAPTAPTGSASALRPLLLIVVDALRDDTARDGEAMPALAALAAGGHRETVDIELLLPSTVGALETIVEGVPPPPAAALSDFAAPAARDGGWLERLVAHGGSAFVAGPDLWTERYGRWIANAHVEAGLPTARSDERVAAAALRALAERSPTLVIAHLAELDAVAHRHGADTPEWDAAVRRVNAHVATLVEAAPGRAVIVVADHGTTRRGGHAGGERVARRVPLLAAGFPVAGVRSASARPCELVSAALFADGRCRATGELALPAAADGSLAIAAVAMLFGGFGILRAVVALSRRALPGFAVSAAVWMALASAALGSPSLGAAIALSTLPAAAAGLGGLLRELLTACLVSGTLAAFAYRAASRANA